MRCDLWLPHLHSSCYSLFPEAAAFIISNPRIKANHLNFPSGASSGHNPASAANRLERDHFRVQRIFHPALKGFPERSWASGSVGEGSLSPI
jgi:hypothetical protein